MYSHLIYGCSLWGNNYDSPLPQLIRLQNKAVRIMNDTPLRDPIVPYYANSGLLKFRDIVKLDIYLTIIPRARMGYESIAHEAEGRMGY